MTKKIKIGQKLILSQRNQNELSPSAIELLGAYSCGPVTWFGPCDESYAIKESSYRRKKSTITYNNKSRAMRKPVFFAFAKAKAQIS